MKMKRLIKASMLLMVATLFAACASEDITQDKKKENGTEAPKGGVIFAANGPKTSAKRLSIGDEDEFAGAKTRTSITHTPGQGADAYWTSDDFIWVKDRNGTWQKSLGTTLHDGGTSAEFTLPGSMADYNDGCEVRYTGTKAHYSGALSASAVFIPKEQSRTTANDFTHAGDWGDCGSGKAYNTGNPRKFNFTLVHKPVYLCFLPRCTNAELAPNIRLKGIKITATKNYSAPTSFMADQCDFDGENISSSGGSPFGDVYINVTLSDFPLSTIENQAANATYLVVRPGKYDFKIEYTIKDPTTNVETVITDIRTGITLDKENIYDVTANLAPARDYSRLYYKWDAQQDYWYGYEWNQPLSMGWDAVRTGEHYPKSQATDPQRWGNTTPHAGRYDAQTQLFRTLPNVNEQCWYAMKGDPHWDNTTAWSLMGHLYKGGMWFKKKAKIMADEHISNAYMENGYPNNGVYADQRWIQYSSVENRDATAINTPVPNKTDYFYLPAVGHYWGSRLDYVGTNGYYWSSSRYANVAEFGCFLGFNKTYAIVTFSKQGFKAIPFE